MISYECYTDKQSTIEVILWVRKSLWWALWEITFFVLIKSYVSYLIQVWLAMLGIGVEIGRLPTEQHQVSGTLHVTDSRTLFIEDFNYDGGGPGIH